jgi:hypothetical protein
LKPKEVSVQIQLLEKHVLSLRQIAVAIGCAVSTARPHLALDVVRHLYKVCGEKRGGEGMHSWTIRSRLHGTTPFVFEHRK